MLIFASSCSSDESDDVSPSTSASTNNSSTTTGAVSTTGGNTTVGGTTSSSPIETTDGSYFPINQGAQYTYSRGGLGDYTIEFNNTEEINGNTYTVTNTTINGQTQVGYVSNTNEVVTQITDNPINPSEQISLVILDASKGIGSSWNGGTVTFNNDGLISTTVYTGKIITVLESYTTPNESVYNDILQVEFLTTTTASIDQAYLNDLPTETRATIESLFQDQLSQLNQSITQTTYYAKNIGFIYQESEQQNQLLRAELVSKNF